MNTVTKNSRRDIGGVTWVVDSSSGPNDEPSSVLVARFSLAGVQEMV